MIKALGLLSFLVILPAFAEKYQRELLLAISLEDYATAESMIFRFNKQGLDLSNGDPQFTETPLTMAVKKGWLRGVRILLVLHVNPHVRNEDGFTPLVLADNLRKNEIATVLWRHLSPLPLQDNSISRF